MKILFLNYEYPPLGGGAANATFYLLKEFSGFPDMEIDLVTSSVNDKFTTERVGGNINIFRLPIGKKEKNYHYQTQKELLTYSWKAYRYSRRLIKDNKYDLVLAFFGIPCGYIAMKLGLPYVVSLRGSDVPFYNERFNMLDKLLFRRLSRKIWKRAEAVVALSQDLVNLARRTSKNQPIEIIYNGVNVDEFEPDKNILAREEKFHILFVGRLIKRKGLDYLLEAVRNLANKYPEIRLTIAGDGPLLEQYKKFVLSCGLEPVVNFLGNVAHSQMPAIYRKSHIFVMPSLNEALGNVTQEALASGLPIITTNTGAAELIDGNGFVIRKKSFQDISDCLEKVIQNENLLREMSKKSREAAEKMSWGENARQYAEILKKVSLGEKKAELKSKLKLLLKFIATGAFITWIFFKINWNEVLFYFKQMDIWWMFGFVLIYAAGIGISSYKWKILADFRGFSVKFRDLFKIYLTGAFINNFFPSIIGGDTYRSYTLGKAGKGRYLEATSTVLVDRITGFAGVMLLILIFSLFNLEAVIQNKVLIAVNAAIILFFLANLLIAVVRRLAIWNYIKNILPEKITKIIQEILSYQKQEILVKSLAWGAIFNFLGVGVATWMLFLDLHIPISFVNFMIAISIISITSSIPVSIGNIGIKEWSFITFFGIFGVSGEAAISIAIFGRFLQMLVSFFAVPFYLKEKNKKIVSL